MDNTIKITFASGEVHECNAYNTAVFIFPKEFAAHNHVFCVTDPGANEGCYIFGRPDVLKTLRDSLEVPIHYLPYVPDSDIAAYQQWVEQERQARAAENAITEDEIARFHEEVEQDGVVQHIRDELGEG